MGFQILNEIINPNVDLWALTSQIPSEAPQSARAESSFRLPLPGAMAPEVPGLIKSIARPLWACFVTCIEVRSPITPCLTGTRVLHLIFLSSIPNQHMPAPTLPYLPEMLLQLQSLFTRKVPLPECLENSLPNRRNLGALLPLRL